MCLRGLSKDSDRDSCKNTGLYGNVYDFSVDYSAISNDKILDIHAYLMNRNGIICLDLLKSVFLQQSHLSILIYHV